MSQATIGRGALILTTDYADLARGLKAAEGVAAAGAQKVAATGTKALAGAIKPSGVVDSFKKAFKGEEYGPKGMLAGLAGTAGYVARIAAPLAAAAAAAYTVSGALDKVADSGEKARTAMTLGMTQQGYGGIAAAAGRFGVDGAALLEGLVDMSGRAAEAIGGGRFAESLQKLKLDPKTVMGQGVEQQFYTFADALKGVAEPAERARLTLMVFGEDVGKKMLPLLAQGGDGVRKLAADAKATGQVLDAEQSARMATASAAVGRASAVLDGGLNKLAAAAAPLIEVAADGIAALRPVIDWVARAASPVATFVAGVVQAIGQAVASVATWVDASLGVSDRWPTIETVVTTALKHIAVAGGYAWDVLKAGAGAVAVGIGKLVGAYAALQRSLTNLLVPMAKALPADLKPGWVDGYLSLVDRVNRGTANAGAGMEAWGHRQMSAFGQSADQVGQWFDRLAAKKAKVEDVKPRLNPAAAGLWKGNDAIEARSKQEVSAQIRAVMGAQADKQLAEQRKGNALHAQGVAALQAISSKLPVIGGVV